MVLCWKISFNLQQHQTQKKDILYIKLQVKGEIIRMILIYAMVVREDEEKKGNLELFKEVRAIIRKCEEEELIYILGDFNGHIGIIGDQQINYNGKMIMDLMIEYNLILVNDSENARGYIHGTEDNIEA